MPLKLLNQQFLILSKLYSLPFLLSFLYVVIHFIQKNSKKSTSWAGLLTWAVIDAWVDKALVNLTRKALRETITKETEKSKAELERINKKIEEWKQLDAQEKAMLKKLGEKIEKRAEEAQKTQAEQEAWDKLKSKETKPKNKVTRKATKKTSKKSEAKNKVTNKSTKSLDKKGTNDYNTEDKGGPLQTLVSSQKWDESTRTTSFFTTQKNNKWKDVLIRTKNWKEQVIESTAKNKDMFTNEEKFDFKPEWGWYEDLILFMMRYIMEK